MLRIELDWVLDYLLTGEESEHQAQVLRLLARQPDCGELLRQARAALEVLGQGTVGMAVRQRLAQLEELVDRPRPGALRMRQETAPVNALRLRSAAAGQLAIESALRSPRSAAPDPATAVARAVAQGRQHVRRETLRSLRKQRGRKPAQGRSTCWRLPSQYPP